MHEWNIVVTVHPGGFVAACRALGRLGQVSRTAYFNVLTMRAEPPRALIARLGEMVAGEPGLLNAVSRAIPGDHVFDFESRRDFEDQARAIVRTLAPGLAARRFCVRVRRRGAGTQISRTGEEQGLGEAVLSALAAQGQAAEIAFEDVDAVIAVEIIDHRAAIALLTREEMARYPFLRVV